jgi:hypothetical protein
MSLLIGVPFFYRDRDGTIPARIESKNTYLYYYTTQIANLQREMRFFSRRWGETWGFGADEEES